MSGGEEGARYGPSLMPGGHPDAWPHIKNIFQSISAKASGEPCCDWVSVGREGGREGRITYSLVMLHTHTCTYTPHTTQVGEDGAGHYVKMVHNGIEYGDMQVWEWNQDRYRIETWIISEGFSCSSSARPTS